MRPAGAGADAKQQHDLVQRQPAASEGISTLSMRPRKARLRMENKPGSLWVPQTAMAMGATDRPGLVSTHKWLYQIRGLYHIRKP